MDICEIKNDETALNDHFIRVKGQIEGYHEVVIFSDKCPSSEHFLQLDLDTTERDRLLASSSTTGNVEKNEIKGEAFVYGQLVKYGGKLSEYPPRRINTKAPSNGVEITVVNKLRLVRIERFIPRAN